MESRVPLQAIGGDRHNLPQRGAPFFVARATQPRLQQGHDRLLGSPIHEDDEAESELLFVLIVETGKSQEDLGWRRVMVIALLPERRSRHLVWALADPRMRVDHGDLLGLRQVVQDRTRACEQRGATWERLLGAEPLQQRSGMFKEVQLPR